MAALTETEFNAIEELIDSHDLAEVITSIHEICLLKAEHLRSNWQDAKGARVWKKAARTIDKAIGPISDLGL